MNFLQGKKTYILAIGAILYAVGGLISGHLDLQTALTVVYSSGVISTFRSAIATHQATVNKVLDTVNAVNQASQTANGASYTVNPQ